MPDIEIVKLKIRRGTDSQRKQVALEQGELGYTTDTKRTFIGDGATLGGAPAGNITHAPLSVNTRTNLNTAVKGDLVYEDNLLYQLSGTDYATLSSWAFIGSRPDDLNLQYNASNELSIKPGSVSISSLSGDVAKDKGGLLYTPDGLSANVDQSTITVDSITGALSVIGGTVTSSVLGNGLCGGSGSDIAIDATSTFCFPAGQLQINTLPAQSVQADALCTSSVGATLNVSGNVLNQATVGANTAQPFNQSVIDQYGRVTSSSTAIEQNLSGTDTSGNGQIFFGSLNEENPGATGETVINALSANSDRSASVAIALSSAGFIQIASGDQGNFAIPIFKF